MNDIIIIKTHRNRQGYWVAAPVGEWKSARSWATRRRTAIRTAMASVDKCSTSPCVYLAQ